MQKADATTIAELDQFLAEHDLGGSWKRDGGRAQFKPYLWRWADLHEALMRVGSVVSMDETGSLAGRLAGRKNIGLRNPSLAERGMKTITLGLQILMPGEVAEAHRHSQAGLRFIVKGNPKAAMVVEGETFPMEDGDLITTPAWAWHDYYNDGDEPVYWLDGLDLPLTRLAHTFREVYPEPRQPITKSAAHSRVTLGAARPRWLDHGLATPPFRYPWAEAIGSIEALRQAETDPDPADGYHVGYAHPLTGGATTPTFSAGLQLLPARFRGEAHRHNSSTFYYVVRGRGTTTVEGDPLDWAQGDIFVVPPWTAHQHDASTEDALLYSITDRPTLEAFEFYREEIVRPGR